MVKIKVEDLRNFLSEFYYVNSIEDFFGNTWGEPPNIFFTSLEDRPRETCLSDDSYNHFARVMYLIQNPDENPISLDVGIPHMCYMPTWPIEDGNHRYLAALLSGKEFINVDFSGSVSFFEELFQLNT